MLNVVMLSVIMLNVVMLNVVMLSFVAPPLNKSFIRTVIMLNVVRILNFDVYNLNIGVFIRAVL
jgi:hypothetical protein